MNEKSCGCQMVSSEAEYRDVILLVGENVFSVNKVFEAQSTWEHPLIRPWCTSTFVE